LISLSREKLLTSEIQNKFILPFSSAENSTAKLSPDKEVAAVFTLAEMDREKGGRIISRNTSENIAFISKIGYPLCMYSSGDKVFLFDGLNVQEHDLPFTKLANVKTFLDRLKSSTKQRDSFLPFLGENVNYFSKLDEKQIVKLKGLIADPGALKEIDAYRNQALDSPDQFADVGLISSPINDSCLMAVTHEIATTKSTLEKELSELNKSIEQLGKSHRVFHSELHEEIATTRQEFALEIKHEEVIIAPILRSIHEKYDRKIADLGKTLEKQTIPLHSEKLMLAKNKEELTKEISKYEASAKLASDTDKVSKERWKNKIKNAKEALLAAEKQLKRNQKSFEDLQKKKTDESQRLKAENELEIKGARSKIVELESTRDAKILVAKQELEELERLTKLISDQLAKAVKARELDLAQFDKLHLHAFSKKLDKAFLYLSFYGIAYDKEGKSRYQIIEPSVTGELGVSTKLKAALGGSKIKSLFSPRFKDLSFLEENMEQLMKSNSVFSAEVKRLGVENNILAKGWTAEEIERGLLALKEQGWLNDKEYGAVTASCKTLLK
jgi:hypothetical protein